MPDMMAIVSKAVFEKAAGKSPELGTQLRMDRYVSANKNLQRLSEGGRLYLVTVRPPDEALWLVAILDNPKFEKKQWIAKACETPLVDISNLKRELVFESGKGLPTKKGTLGMSLQTPRAITDEDARLLDEAAGASGGDGAKGKAGKLPPPPKDIASTGTANRRGLLLEAVIADSQNDGAKLVYADALTQANDPRGEFITLDIALDGRLSIRRRDEMKQRRDQLLAANRKKWFTYKGIRLRIHHGFAIAATGSLKSLNAASELFETEPIEEVEVTGMTTESVAKLVRALWLPRVRRLIVRGKIGDEGFETLVGAPKLAGLHALNVTGNRIGPDGLAGLEDHLPDCRTLVLTRNKLGAKGIAKLLLWKHIGELETLYLGKCDLDGTAANALLDGPPLSALTKLALTGNGLGNGVGALFERNADKLPALRYLDLVRTGLMTAGAKQLAGAKLPAIQRIDARSNRVDAKAVGDSRIRT